jgi:hypothetical protein
MTWVSTIWRAAAAALIVASGALVSDLSAQTAPARRQPTPAVEAGPGADRIPADRMDADSTRGELMQILVKHPPSVGRVLKLDPSLMRNESYLETYPEIKNFLAAHPEVPQNAPYYLEHVRVGNENWGQSSRERMTEAILAGVAGFTAFIVVLSTIIWLIRTVIEHRRWNRLSKIQAEVHTKLMDRFSSNDELLTYVQTPSGRRFLESGPSPLQEITPAMGAPFSRILWSVQLGSVLLVSGVGLLFLSGRAIQEAREFFYIAGCLATAIGSGFIVSAAAAYLLSRRLGLLERSVHDHA